MTLELNSLQKKDCIDHCSISSNKKVRKQENLILLIPFTPFYAIIQA
jgi:hypothetical protein